MTTPELSDADIAKLEAKAAKIKKEQQETDEALAKAYASRKNSSIQRVNELIAELKLTVDDVASISIVKDAIKMALKGTTKAPATTTKGNTSTYVAPEPKWCNPADPTQTYSGGRGQKPQWLKVALKEGKSMDDFLIKKP